MLDFEKGNQETSEHEYRTRSKRSSAGTACCEGAVAGISSHRNLTEEKNAIPARYPHIRSTKRASMMYALLQRLKKNRSQTQDTQPSAEEGAKPVPQPVAPTDVRGEASG